jgi:hypothetical protein
MQPPCGDTRPSQLLRNYYLSSSHYASKWKVREVSDRHDRELINEKAYEFATTKNPVLREALQLEVLEAFHAYLIKYFNLIVFGDVPALTGPQGKDAQAFLKLLMPKGTKKPTLADLQKSAKHLHLAFKNCITSDEVYDTLVAVFLDVAAHYDPHYTKKTEEVCNFIEKQPSDAVIKIDEFGSAVDFDPLGCIRVLVRHNYLQSVSGARKKVLGYQRGENWPPAKSFFEAGPVGFTYFLTKWFRYYLQAHIQTQMGQIESKEHVMQLDHIESSNVDDDGWNIGGLPHADGNWVDQRGVRWAADLSMLEHWKTLDVSLINDAWVKSTDDHLFKTLTREERYLLQLVFVKELNWTEIAVIFDKRSETVRAKFDEVMEFLVVRGKERPWLATAA